MVGNDDSRAPCHHSSSRKMFWRSASWSSARSAAANNTNSSGEPDPSFADPNSGVQNPNRRFPPPPLTPRSQQNCKARSSCLPPLQPLSIARRSLDEWPKASSDDIGEWPQPPITPGGRGNYNSNSNNSNNGERLKLDLSSIQQNNGSGGNSRNNRGLVKRDKIAFFDKECSKVAEHVYLGGDAVAKDRDILKKNEITHVLNCVGFVCPEYFKADFVYRTLWLQDSPSEDITSILYDVFDYFEDVREQNGRVFVHCCQGVSRSTSLVIAYLMWREGQSFDDAFQFVKAARGIADPNMGFACQLLQCQKRVHAFPLSPSSLLRMYRIAPHSPYDPLHLVPKMLTDPTLSALDSRGAFIVHIPSAIYVWIGKKCEAIMERDAKDAVGQIVRYEKVQGPIIIVKEGDEPASFSDAFTKYLPLMNTSGSGRVENSSPGVKIWAGERKVDAYDVDFGVFQKAITGGFVPPFASSENEHETHLPARESSWSGLRRKVSSANMKEFVSAPKLSFTRVYSDSMLCVHNSTNAPPSPSLSSTSSTTLSSSSSPSFVSPDSISSDSSTHSKFLSDLSPDSSSLILASVPVSPPLSNFSNLSLSSNSTSQQVSNSTNIHDVELFHPYSQSASLPLKKPSTSLAERRGSLSKSLKLPLMNDKIQVIDKPSTFYASQGRGVVLLNSYSCVQHSDSIDYLFESNNHVKDGGTNSIQQYELSSCPGIVDNVGCKEASLPRNRVESSVDSCLREDLKSMSAKETDVSGSLQCSVPQTLAYRWPSLEKIDTFGASQLDSKAAFVIFSPSVHIHAGNVLYFWVGRYFNQDASQVRLDSDRWSVDWNQIGCDLLAHFRLPKNTVIKNVKENEEPGDFLALLRSL